MINPNEYLKDSINVKSSSVLSAEVKMLKGKTAMILVEGKDDYRFYNQVFKKNTVRSCFKEEDYDDLMEIDSYIYKKYNKRDEDNGLTCKGVKDILSNAEISKYSNIIGIIDKDYKTINIELNTEIIPVDTPPKLFYVDKNDLETTILSLNKNIIKKFENYFGLNFIDLYQPVIDICTKISAVRYTNYMEPDTLKKSGYNIKKGTKNLSKCIIVNDINNVVFDYSMFCDFVDYEKPSRKNIYEKIYNIFKKNSLDLHLLFVGHDFVDVLSIIISKIKKDDNLKSNCISNQISDLLLNYDNSGFDKSELINEIKKYQKQSFVNLIEKNLLIDD